VSDTNPIDRPVRVTFEFDPQSDDLNVWADDRTPTGLSRYGEQQLRGSVEALAYGNVFVDSITMEAVEPELDSPADERYISEQLLKIIHAAGSDAQVLPLDKSFVQHLVDGITNRITLGDTKTWPISRDEMIGRITAVYLSKGVEGPVLQAVAAEVADGILGGAPEQDGEAGR